LLFELVERLRCAPVIGPFERMDVMTVFRANFLAGILVGVALAIAAPLAGTELVAGLSPTANANSAAVGSESALSQTVNRSGKSDRLHPRNAASSSRPKIPKIPEGCDTLFSPLSRGAASNYVSRCLS
jgi:hypothetical protein